MNRLNLITLGVKDMVESLNFYRNGLGFEVVVYGDETNPDVIFFNDAGTKISLFQLDRLMKDINETNPPSVQGGFGGITLAYNGKSKEEVDEVFLLAEKAGAKIVKEPETVFWGGYSGYSGYFQDPNGFYWEVAYGEDWEFDKNDMLIISKG
ncbi:VOC family protein [Priestia megaterium]|uniref:VOC family protein n=1 Tax=Priestia megaterium TaxID=1404 RepID=UPI002E24853F|nr:VOC family protein [Priestia megaterium]